MASNFKIQIQSKNRTLHVFLRGDFDGSSAEELKWVLKQQSNKHEKIYLHTDKLGKTNEFGLNIFRDFLSRNRKKAPEIEITGNPKNFLPGFQKDATNNGDAGSYNYLKRG
jgi:anti-anti-sigma regulatory factor